MPQLAQTREFEPEHPPVAQRGLTQVPERHHGRVEQLRVRVEGVGQFRQELGHVIAGVECREVAAQRREAFDGRGLREEVQRLRRLVQQHDIRTAEQVKSTLERRLQPPPPLRQGRHLAEVPGEQGQDQARLEHLDGPQDQGLGADGGHAEALPESG